MSADIKYLIDTINVHRSHNMPKVYVPSLTGEQRQYLNDIGVTSYRSCEPHCCVIDLS